MVMTHPGMPVAWGALVLLGLLLITSWVLMSRSPVIRSTRRWRIDRLPLLGSLAHFITATPWALLALRLVMVGLFVLVIVAGLSGSPVAGRNLATVLTWNLWWTGLILLIFFLGSAWCSVCPWDAIASWLVKRRLWQRAGADTSLNLYVPAWLRNVWPALLLFVGLTWLELGVGITLDPYATALVALAMVVMTTTSMALFKRKAFCRYFCPVGRTIGFYSQLAPVELRPIDNTTCSTCTTLECYHGSRTVDPCPTGLVMGTLRQNTYCTSCTNCARSCPHQNVAWRLRSPSTEAIQDARPHWDEAWFMLGLMTLTTFHGITMMPFWEQGISRLARVIGDSGQLLWSFSVGLIVSMTVPIAAYALAVALTQFLASKSFARQFRQRFVEMAFVAIPLAFAYHIAHNLNHLLREDSDVLAMIVDPLGRLDSVPLTVAERAQLYNGLLDQRNSLFDTSYCISITDGGIREMLISQGALFSIQALLLVAGFYVAARIIRHRGRSLIVGAAVAPGWRLSPLLLFAILVTAGHLWLLMQPMVMRM